MRTANVQHYQIEGIAENKHFNILSTGKVLYTKDTGWERRDKFLIDVADIIPHTATSYYIEKKNDFYYIRNSDGYLSNLNYGNVCIWEPDIDTLYFRNKRTNWYRQAAFGNFYDTNFVFKKNGKYGLGTFSDKSTINSPFRIEKKLPPIFDDIKTLDDPDDIFNSNPDGDQRMVLYKDGLIGLFPIHTDVRYRKLRVYVVFARFILPSGKKGWVNTYTGEEFFDE